ncbi:ABC transporter permease [Leifsonia sp. TF02-11]|uniref:ABC transporter permease n=1 Tax=Leifsonia sp. TF02-11 TaxID=2815212 RepID=UPI001FB5C6C4|nr:ABC transporter permease [Leifsonia sp. TF02-11]
MRVDHVRVVARFEFTRTVRRPQFWIAALLLPAVMAAVILVMSWAGSNGPAATEPIEFEYSDSSGIVSESAAAELGGRPARADAADRVRSGQLAAFLDYPSDPTTEAVTIIAADRGLMANSVYSQLAQRLFSASVDLTLDSDRAVALVRADLRTTVQTYTDGNPAGGVGGMILPGLLALLLLVTVALLGNQMLSSTVEERENRVSEMLLVSMPARALIHGKILALALVGVVQIGIFIVASVTIYLIASPSLPLDELGIGAIAFDPLRLAVGLLLLLGGLLTLTALLVLTGAAMPSAKDAAPFFSAVVIVTIAPIYFITTILLDPGSPVVLVLSYFPFTAPMTALILNATGALTPWAGIAIAGGLFIVGTIILRLAVFAFQRGVIQYDRRLRLSDFISHRRRS